MLLNIQELEMLYAICESEILFINKKYFKILKIFSHNIY